MDEFVTVRVTTKMAVLGEQRNILCRQMVRSSEEQQLWLMARPRAPCQEYVSLWGQSRVRHAQEVQRRFNSKQGVLGDLRLLPRTQQQFWN